MKFAVPAVALLTTLLATCSAKSQPPYAKPVQQPSSDKAATTESVPAPVAVSPWLVPDSYTDEVPPGPPIGVEIYFQSGFSVPLRSSLPTAELLGRDMKTGYVVQGGVRTLFFNEAATRAWVVDLSLSHFSNGHNQDIEYPLRVIDFTGNFDPNTGQDEVKLIQFGTPTKPGIKIRDTDRTYVNLGIGRDYFLFGGTAESEGRNWRFGWDLGGRYGALSQEYDILKHRTDVIGGVYGGVHSDVLVPSRWGVLLFGFRTEWAYTWSDILQRASDIEEVNFMLTLGWRY
jgi:hypothetical protein